MKTKEFIRRAVLTLLAMLTAATGWAEIIGDASGTCGDNLT